MDQLFVAADYKNRLIEKILKLYKYRFISEIALPLGILLTNYIRNRLKKNKINLVEGNPLLVPVPLSQVRLNWRGFNQSELLAFQLSEKFQLDLESKIIERKFSHLHQADIEDRNIRIQNVQNKFSVVDSKKVSGRNIILIDDICTTGATLNECAKTLKQSGAIKVSALVVARG